MEGILGVLSIKVLKKIFRRSSAGRGPVEAV